MSERYGKCLSCKGIGSMRVPTGVVDPTNQVAEVVFDECGGCGGTGHSGDASLLLNPQPRDRVLLRTPEQAQEARARSSRALDAAANSVSNSVRSWKDRNLSDL